jgi:hypothetical protein
LAKHQLIRPSPLRDAHTVGAVAAMEDANSRAQSQHIDRVTVASDRQPATGVGASQHPAAPAAAQAPQRPSDIWALLAGLGDAVADGTISSASSEGGEEGGEEEGGSWETASSQGGWEAEGEGQGQQEGAGGGGGRQMHRLPGALPAAAAAARQGQPEQLGPGGPASAPGGQKACAPGL